MLSHNGIPPIISSDADQHLRGSRNAINIILPFAKDLPVVPRLLLVSSYRE